VIGFLSYVLVIAGIYTIFALSLQLQFGLGGLANFALVAFMAVSAYTMAILTVTYRWPLLGASLAALAAALILAAVLAIPALRLRADYLAIATIAAAEIVRYLALNLDAVTGGASGTVNLPRGDGQTSYTDGWRQWQEQVHGGIESLTGLSLSNDQVTLLVVWVIAGLLGVAMWSLARSPWGRVLRATRDSEDAAASLGKNVYLIKIQAFGTGAVVAAVAGLFLAWQLAVFSPQDFLPEVTFFAFVIVILGGSTRVWAVPIAALLFAFLYAATRFLGFWPLSLFGSGERAYVRLVVIGLALIALMMWRPQGLFGRRWEAELD
jgi:branched-chain amino acid transport system permease protein